MRSSTGEELESLDFTEVRGTDGIKEASYTVNGMEVKVCVVSRTCKRQHDYGEGQERH